MGGGVAGLATAVLLSRDGHQVTLLERDPLDTGPADAAPAWRRRGIPHFLQPHAFIPRGRLELRSNLPDVYDALLAAGAWDVDLRRKLPGEVQAEDEVLQYLAVRRPVVEWGLRRAAAAEPNLELCPDAALTGLLVGAGRVTGARVGEATLDADVVVDALGRRTPTPAWLEAAGLSQPPVESSDCGVLYYSRYYRQRPGFELADGPFVLSPRGDLGYLGFSTFPGDNGAFASVLAVPTGVPEWRVLADSSAYEAASATIPALRAWVDPDGVDPITDVMPMAGLRNTLRHCDALPMGLVAVGDAASHTDPVLAHGLSFALIHAAVLAKAMRDHADDTDAGGAFRASTSPALRERYDLATALDDERHRMWLGEQVDFPHHDGAYALFSLVAAGAVAMVDADVFRTFVRRIGLLDSTAVLDDDLESRRRITKRFEELRSMPRPPVGPGRDEMLATLADAART